MNVLNRAAFLQGGATGLLTTLLPARASADDDCNPEASGHVRMRALVLSGGTAHGAYEAGALSRLDRNKYDFVVGTSIGALNGAIFVSQPIPANPYDTILDRLWRNVATEHVLQQKEDFIRVQRVWGLLKVPPAYRLAKGATLDNLTSLCETEPVRNVLKKYLLFGGGQAIVDFAKPLIWTATDLSTGCAGYFYRAPTQETLTLADGTAVSVSDVKSRLKQPSIQSFDSDPNSFIEALRASSAIPGVFDPATVTDSENTQHTLVDGGVVNNTPMVLAMRAARVLVPNGRLDLTLDTIILGSAFAGSANSELKNILGIALGCYSVMSQRLFDEAARQCHSIGQQFDDELDQLTSLNHGVDKGRALSAARQSFDRRIFETPIGLLERCKLPTTVSLNVLRPSADLKGSPYDFDAQDLVNFNFNLGAWDATHEPGFSKYIDQPEFCDLT